MTDTNQTECKRGLLSRISRYLFSELDNKKIKYCVLRNYEGLPDDVGDHDIDILINRRDKLRAHGILQSMKDVFDIDWIRVGERQYVISYYMIYNENTERVMLQIDFFFDMDWHGRTMMDADYMLTQCRTYNGIKIPRPAHEAITSLYSSLIRGGFYKVKYHESIKRLLGEDTMEFSKCLHISVGPYADELINHILNDEIDSCEKMVFRLRKEITKNSFRRYPVKTLCDLIRFVHWELHNRIYVSGNMYAVVGGTEEQRIAFVNTILPYIKKYYKNEGKLEKCIVMNRDVSKSSNVLKRAFDFWKSYFVKVHKRLNKTYGIVYCGYYCDDVHIKSGKKVKQPDCIFDLSGNQNEKYSKKVIAVRFNMDVEKVIVDTITENDKSRYKNFVNKNLATKEAL